MLGKTSDRSSCHNFQSNIFTPWLYILVSKQLIAIFSLVSDNGETFLNDLVVHFVCIDFTLEMKRRKIRAMVCFSLFS